MWHVYLVNAHKHCTWWQNTLLPYDSKHILKALGDRIEEIDAIQAKTQIEMNILLATLLELELTGTLENIGGQIYRLTAEMDITVHWIK